MFRLIVTAEYDDNRWKEGGKRGGKRSAAGQERLRAMFDQNSDRTSIDIENSLHRLTQHVILHISTTFDTNLRFPSGETMILIVCCELEFWSRIIHLAQNLLIN